MYGECLQSQKIYNALYRPSYIGLVLHAYTHIGPAASILNDLLLSTNLRRALIASAHDGLYNLMTMQ